jgi:hypothetical protein
MDMPKPRRAAGAAQPPKDKRNFTIWTDREGGERIEKAAAAAAARAGFPVSTSAWLLAQVMRGVEEEEKRGKGGGR